MAKRGLAWTYRSLNYLNEAYQLAEESYASLERMGDRQSMMLVRYLQLLIRRSEENYEEALRLVEECLTEFTYLKDELHVAYCLIHQGDFHKFLDDWETAVQKWQAALSVAQRVDNQELIEKLKDRLSSDT